MSDYVLYYKTAGGERPLRVRLEHIMTEFAHTYDSVTDCRDSRGYGYELLDHTIEIINDELGK